MNLSSSLWSFSQSTFSYFVVPIIFFNFLLIIIWIIVFTYMTSALKGKNQVIAQFGIFSAASVIGILRTIIGTQIFNYSQYRKRL